MLMMVLVEAVGPAPSPSACAERGALGASRQRPMLRGGPPLREETAGPRNGSALGHSAEAPLWRA